MEQDERLLSAVFNVGRLIKERMHSGKCLDDFTHTEVEILKFLAGKGKTTMKGVADYMHIKPSSATSAIDKLVEKGSVKRIADKGDRRVVYIALTSKGTKALKEKYENIHKVLNEVFGGLALSDKKLLIEILEKLYA